MPYPSFDRQEPLGEFDKYILLLMHSCISKLHISSIFQGPVYIYYGLDNFFQNHRKYVKSRDDTQLMGSFENDLGKSAPSPDCAPFAMANATFGYAPCGAVANSLFNGWSNFSTLRSISLWINLSPFGRKHFWKNFEPFNDVAHFTCL